MDPIASGFAHNYQKYVLQEPNIREMKENYNVFLRKPFEIEPPVKGTDKTKKDLQKEGKEKGKEEKK